MNKLKGKNKILLITIILIIFLTTLGIIYRYISKNSINKINPEDYIQLKSDLTFEINSEVDLFSLIGEENKAKILSRNEPIDTSVLGEKEIIIKYDLKGKEEFKKINAQS